MNELSDRAITFLFGFAARCANTRQLGFGDRGTPSLLANLKGLVGGTIAVLTIIFDGPSCHG